MCSSCGLPRSGPVGGLPAAVRNSGSDRLTKHRLCLFEIGLREALAEGPIDPREGIARGAGPVAVARQTRKTRRGTQLPQPCALLPRQRERGLEFPLGTGCIAVS